MYEPTANEDDYNKGWEDAVDMAIVIVEMYGPSFRETIEALYEQRG